MTKFGSANGYALRRAEFLKSPGYRSTGRTRLPPMLGPKTDPTFHTSGIMLKALGCSSRCGTISATTVRMIPTLPLEKPCIDRAAKAMAIELENPNMRVVIMTRVKASRIIGLRPKRSEALPHTMAVRHCEREKQADSQPEYFAT